MKYQSWFKVVAVLLVFALYSLAAVSLTWKIGSVSHAHGGHELLHAVATHFPHYLLLTAVFIFLGNRLWKAIDAYAGNAWKRNHEKVFQENRVYKLENILSYD